MANDQTERPEVAPQVLSVESARAALVEAVCLYAASCSSGVAQAESGKASAGVIFATNVLILAVQATAEGEIASLKDDVRVLEGWLGECYALTGADPDDNADAMLAPHAVEEVTRLRREADAAELALRSLQEAQATTEQQRNREWRERAEKRAFEAGWDAMATEPDHDGSLDEQRAQYAASCHEQLRLYLAPLPSPPTPTPEPELE